MELFVWSGKSGGVVCVEWGIRWSCSFGEERLVHVELGIRWRHYRTMYTVQCTVQCTVQLFRNGMERDDQWELGIG